MRIKVRKSWELPESEVTDRQLFLSRREFMRASGLVTFAAIAGTSPELAFAGHGGKPLSFQKSKYTVSDSLTTFEQATTYNNFYEFGTEKSDPALHSRNFKTTPWTVAIDGEVKKRGVFQLDDLLKGQTLEERIYRFRCVEGWSMVVPWIGFPLANLLKQFEPTSRAKFVEFTTLNDPNQMPGQKRAVLRWPYVEGLRIDEAMHPLALMTVGMYGEVLPNQNGAPFRLIVPWKYGFKNIKSIVKIRLVEHMPLTTWVDANAGEYGFYSNVNPQVDHPRWSQKRERRLGEFLKRDTLMFNGYGDEVASLYSGMDLKLNY